MADQKNKQLQSKESGSTGTSVTGGIIIGEEYSPKLRGRAALQKYDEMRRYQIAQSALWAHPAITGRSIIVKDVDKVICWSF